MSSILMLSSVTIVQAFGATHADGDSFFTRIEGNSEITVFGDSVITDTITDDYRVIVIESPGSITITTENFATGIVTREYNGEIVETFNIHEFRNEITEYWEMPERDYAIIREILQELREFSDNDYNNAGIQSFAMMETSIIGFAEGLSQTYQIVNVDGNFFVEPFSSGAMARNQTISVGVGIPPLHIAHPPSSNVPIHAISRHSSDINMTVQMRFLETLNSYIRIGQTRRFFRVDTTVDYIALALGISFQTVLGSLLAVHGLVSATSTILTSINAYSGKEYSFWYIRQGQVFDTTLANRWVNVVNYQGAGRWAFTWLPGGPGGTLIPTGWRITHWAVSQIEPLHNLVNETFEIYVANVRFNGFWPWN